MKYFKLFFLCLLLAGCQGAQVDAPVVGGTPVGGQAPVTADASGAARSGNRSFSFYVPGESGEPIIKVDSQGQIQVSDDAWKTERVGGEVKVLRGDQLVAVAKQKKVGQWEVDDAQGNKIVKVKSREDGGFKVVDPGEMMLVKLKKRDDGYKVVDSDEETTLIKVSAREGRVKVKDGKETDLAKVKGTSNTLFITWMSIEKLPLPVRLAMATMTWRDIDG